MGREPRRKQQRVWLAALTAAFMAGSMAIAHAQAGGGGAAAGGGGGGDGGAAAGSGSGGSGGQGGGDSTGTRRNASPIYKDERFPQRR
jgi:hypothetical protein